MTTPSKAMTAEERAEQIYQFLLKPESSLSFKDPTDYIAAQIREAMDEAYERSKTERHQQCPYEEGFLAGELAMQKRTIKFVRAYPPLDDDSDHHSEKKPS